MLVALVANDMRVVHSDEVLGANYADVKHTHGALDEVAMDALGTLELLTGLLKPRVVGHDALLNLLFSLNQLVLSRNILLRELSDFNASIGILVQLLKQLIDDLGAVLVIDTLVHQKVVHLVTVHHSVAICVDLSKLLRKSFGFIFILGLELAVKTCTSRAHARSLLHHHGYALSFVSNC